MKTKLTLLRNALLVGCAMFALSSCSDEDDALNYTTNDCAGTYKGTLTIREHGTGAAGNYLNGSSLSYSNAPFEITALSATQLKYKADSAAVATTTWGYHIDVTVDFVGNGDDMKYFTAENASYTIDSLKVAGNTTKTTYTNCSVLAHAKPLGVRLEIDGGVGVYQGGRVVYLSYQKQLD